jgi:hypothetical protein
MQDELLRTSYSMDDYISYESLVAEAVKFAQGAMSLSLLRFGEKYFAIAPSELLKLHGREKCDIQMHPLVSEHSDLDQQSLLPPKVVERTSSFERANKRPFPRKQL